ncbi:MAG TPA: carbohydrate binding family 9 domain-containing protein, partial [Bacteroidota bacterium]|nr:carbohydrate binding family 9 domain-containing protein [Bacteroidota bacterium]
MKIILILVLHCSISLVSWGDEKSIILKLRETPIVVDGSIDPLWAEADSADDFFQLQPYYAQPPSQRTVAKVLSTRDALYCLMICYDSQPVESHPGLLDQTSGDIVSIMLDTFGDRKSAYKFAVAASGARADCRLLDDARNRDYSWDGVWFADARVYDWGFVAEMMIPYKSIKYNPDLKAWGLDFDRWRPSNAEDLYWCEYEQNEGQRV